MDSTLPQAPPLSSSDTQPNASEQSEISVTPEPADSLSLSNCDCWPSFLEHAAVDFFTGYKLEKMSIEDGNGNKAKFSRTKDQNIKIEYTSSVLL